MTRIRVMVVEDDDFTRSTVKSALQGQGLNIVYDTALVKEGIEFAILTDEISKAWAGLTTKQYKNLKGLKKENLRDNMTNLELVLNMLQGTSFFGDQQNSAGFTVKPVDQFKQLGQGPCLSKLLYHAKTDPRTAVYGNTSRFVDGHQGVVF